VYPPTNVSTKDDQTAYPFANVDALRLADCNPPARKIETSASRQRSKQRERLFVPPVSWLEAANALSRLSTSRAALFWLLLQMQRKLDANEWIVPRLSLLVEANLRDRKARSRAVKELERAGLIEVKRRTGKAALLRVRGSS
jgi:hypothetical protein